MASKRVCAEGHAGSGWDGGFLRRVDADVAELTRSAASVAGIAEAVVEVVCNAVDAQATGITVTLHTDCGGFEVADNGVGMPPGDLGVVGTRYTSSKQPQPQPHPPRARTTTPRAPADASRAKGGDDGSAVGAGAGTFGYHGEALASLIACSAAVTITSRTATMYDARVVEFRNGAAVGAAPGGAGAYRPLRSVPRGGGGTTVVVSGLFALLPVRRKRLLALGTRGVHAVRAAVGALCVARPRVAVRLLHAKETILQKPPTATLRETYAAIHGEHRAASLLHVGSTLRIAAAGDVAGASPLSDSVSGRVPAGPEKVGERHSEDKSTIIHIEGLVSNGSAAAQRDAQLVVLDGRPCTVPFIDAVVERVYARARRGCAKEDVTKGQRHPEYVFVIEWPGRGEVGDEVVAASRAGGGGARCRRTAPYVTSPSGDGIRTEAVLTDPQDIGTEILRLCSVALQQQGFTVPPSLGAVHGVWVSLTNLRRAVVVSARSAIPATPDVVDPSTERRAGSAVQNHGHRIPPAAGCGAAGPSSPKPTPPATGLIRGREGCTESCLLRSTSPPRSPRTHCGRGGAHQMWTRGPFTSVQAEATALDCRGGKRRRVTNPAAVAAAASAPMAPGGVTTAAGTPQAPAPKAPPLPPHPTLRKTLMHPTAATPCAYDPPWPADRGLSGAENSQDSSVSTQPAVQSTAKRRRTTTPPASAPLVRGDIGSRALATPSTVAAAAAPSTVVRAVRTSAGPAARSILKPRSRLEPPAPSAMDLMCALDLVEDARAGGGGGGQGSPHPSRRRSSEVREEGAASPAAAWGRRLAGRAAARVTTWSPRIVNAAWQNKRGGGAAVAKKVLPRARHQVIERMTLQRGDVGRFALIGQAQKQFIFGVVRSHAAGDRGVICAVDQHAADERCKLEALRGRLPALLRSEPLAAPVVLLLTPGELAAVTAAAGALEAFGWRGCAGDRDPTASAAAAPMPALEGRAEAPATTGATPITTVTAGGTRPPAAPPAQRGWRVTHTPKVCLPDWAAAPREVVLKPLSVVQAAAEIVAGGVSPSECRGSGSASVIPSVFHRLLTSKACRSAIMFGDHLTPTACTALLERLARTNDPFHCAHGRPCVAPLCWQPPPPQPPPLAKPNFAALRAAADAPEAPGTRA